MGLDFTRFFSRCMGQLIMCNICGQEFETEEELKKQIEITPMPDDIQYMDAYNHLIEKYVYEQTK